MNNKDVPSPVSPGKLAEALVEYWSPMVIAELEDCYIKVAKLSGSLTWHKHDGQDEMFYVLDGHLLIELEDSQVCLNPGDVYVVPKGTMHNPIAENDCCVMVIERKETRHTGDVEGEFTRSIEEQLESHSALGRCNYT